MGCVGEEEGGRRFFGLQPSTGISVNGPVRQRRHTLYQLPTLTTSLHQLLVGLVVAYPLPIARHVATLEIVPMLMVQGSVHLVRLPLRSQRGSVKALEEEGELPIKSLELTEGM